MGLSVLDDIGASDLFKASLWLEGAKSAAGGAGAIIASGIAAEKLPWISGQGPMLKSVFKAALSIAGAALARDYVGDAAASGMVGGGAGSALAEIVAQFLPVGFRPRGLIAGAGLGALSPEERALLSEAPGSFGEVTVEDASGGFGEVGVEATGIGSHPIHGLDAVSISSFG